MGGLRSEPFDNLLLLIRSDGWDRGQAIHPLMLNRTTGATVAEIKTVTNAST